MAVEAWVAVDRDVDAVRRGDAVGYVGSVRAQVFTSGHLLSRVVGLRGCLVRNHRMWRRDHKTRETRPDGRQVTTSCILPDLMLAGMTAMTAVLLTVIVSLVSGVPSDVRELRSDVRSDLSRMDDRLRAVEVEFGKVDQRLATLERLHLPTPAAPGPAN